MIFDLWETLIDWDREAAEALGNEVAAIVGGDFGERWSHSTTRYNAPIRVALSEAGVPADLHDEICALRLAITAGRSCRGPAPSRRCAGCAPTATWSG